VEVGETASVLSSSLKTSVENLSSNQSYTAADNYKILADKKVLQPITKPSLPSSTAHYSSASQILHRPSSRYQEIDEPPHASTSPYLEVLGHLQLMKST
jgi:hypothetical protein